MGKRKCAYCGGHENSDLVICQHCGGSEWITYNEYRQPDNQESKKSSGTNVKYWYDYITPQIIERIALSIIGFLAGGLLNRKPTGSSSPQSNGSRVSPSPNNVSPSPNVVIYNVIPDKAGKKKKSIRLRRKQRDAIKSRFLSIWIMCFIIFSLFSIPVVVMGHMAEIGYGWPEYSPMGAGIIYEIIVCLLATLIAAEVGPYEDYGPF